MLETREGRTWQHSPQCKSGCRPTFDPNPCERRGKRRYDEAFVEARLADDLGLSSFCTTEQHGVDDGYLPAQLPMITALGVATERVRLITNALLLPLHPWRQVVEQSIVADLVSGGRLSLGVAAGGYSREFDLFGVDFKNRGELMERGLAFLRQGFTQATLDRQASIAQRRLTTGRRRHRFGYRFAVRQAMRNSGPVTVNPRSSTFHARHRSLTLPEFG